MTNDNRDTGLRHQLLASENWDSPLRERYEAEVQALIVQQLTPVRRWSFVVVSIALLAFSVLSGWLAVTVTQLPWVARLMLVEGTVLQLVAAGYCMRVVSKGMFHARRHPVFLSGLMWCFSVLLAVHFLMLIPEISDVRIGVFFVGIMLVTIIGAGIQLLRTCIEQSELNTHERLLETVLRLAPASIHDGDDQ